MANPADFNHYAFVSIGANLPSAVGDAETTIRWAFDQLASLTSAPLRCSSLYRTSPVDSPAGTPDFVNAMAALLPTPGETPWSLLNQLQTLENTAGRTRSGIRNEARALDLDLITFGREIVASEVLTLPHPRAQERKFVLEPLLEITGPDFYLPGQNESVDSLLATISDTQQIQKT